jgi:hypothetical protein
VVRPFSTYERNPPGNSLSHLRRGRRYMMRGPVLSSQDVLPFSDMLQKSTPGFMQVKIQAGSPGRKLGAIEKPVRDYPLRVSSFFLSVATHSLAIVALMFGSFPGGRPERPVYEQFIRPHKILFYDLRKKTPDVAPLKKTGLGAEPRGAELSKQAIIATSPKPKSKQVLMSAPAPELKIPEDFSAPLIVAKLETSIAPPAPPKPKKFVPPKPLDRETKLPMQVPMLDTQAPAINSSPITAPVLPPSLTTSAVFAPPQPAPVAPEANKGNAKADVVVASLHPTDAADVRLPTGQLPAQFSKAPTQGAASSGDAVATLSVPDLTIRQPKREVGPETPMKTVLYAEAVRSVSVSTLSVPLRPQSRMIPRSLDARFQGRNVYTIAVPIENMPAYDGDWIVWFADQESKPGETPLVHAPLPFRKIEPVVEVPPSGRTEERIQVAAILRKSGKLDGITVLTKATPAVQRAVLQDVTAWEFQPATRNGVPVDVDIVLEIPFSLPTAIAKSEQP